MPSRGIHHIDLAVADDERSLGYYAFFAFDPDGIRVEVFCWSRP